MCPFDSTGSHYQRRTRSADALRRSNTPKPTIEIGQRKNKRRPRPRTSDLLEQHALAFHKSNGDFQPRTLIYHDAHSKVALSRDYQPPIHRHTPLNNKSPFFSSLVAHDHRPNRRSTPIINHARSRPQTQPIPVINNVSQVDDRHQSTQSQHLHRQDNARESQRYHHQSQRYHGQDNVHFETRNALEKELMEEKLALIFLDQVTTEIINRGVCSDR